MPYPPPELIANLTIGLLIWIAKHLPADAG